MEVQKQIKSGLNRRDFFTTAAMGLFAMGTLASPAQSRAEEERKLPQIDPERVRKVIEEMEPKIGRYWSTPRKDAEFLHFMVKAARATRVLEVGTSQGYSAIWMGFALGETGGLLTTIEIDGGRHALAQKNVREAGLSGRVTLVRGDAHREITALKGSFDFVFLDADKDGQMDYFKKLYPDRLSPGAIIAVHNAISEAGDMKDYTDMIRRRPDFDTVIVSTTLDDGICMSYRHRSA
ncbi:MAG TPA: class I SAM-dependent methyltransferase [Syntrophales bacterium]|nr:class I SAM-dependent methyltransferase [Syntrophales bacterium]